MDPLRAKKRKKKGVRGVGFGEKGGEGKRERSTSGTGNERKSGNDESIVPVQRLLSL